MHPFGLLVCRAVLFGMVHVDGSCGPVSPRSNSRSSTCELRWLKPAELLKCRPLSFKIKSFTFLQFPFFPQVCGRVSAKLKAARGVCLQFSVWSHAHSQPHCHYSLLCEKVLRVTYSEPSTWSLTSRLELVGFLGEIDPDNSRVPKIWIAHDSWWTCLEAFARTSEYVWFQSLPKHLPWLVLLHLITNGPHKSWFQNWNIAKLSKNNLLHTKTK